MDGFSLTKWPIDGRADVIAIGLHLGDIGDHDVDRHERPGYQVVSHIEVCQQTDQRRRDVLARRNFTL